MITVYGQKVTLQELAKVEPVRPETAGRRWKGLQHAELVNAIKDEVAGRGWRVEQELYSLAREGADMAGALMLGDVKGLPNFPDMNLSLGFINSNARRKALMLTVGTHVRCCCNGMCTGTIVMRRVHDHTLDIFDEIEAAVDRYAIAAQEVPKVVDSLRQADLSEGLAANILLEAGRRKLVGWAAIGRVDAEYRKPTFGEHGKGTSWALLNAFTYAVRKSIHATRQMETYNAFRQLLPTVEVV